ncbi:MAG TPA: glycosyltransferase, partial [Labilithrix sp.]|nr:glycosyltransferase [Labilithrix sp.]
RADRLGPRVRFVGYRADVPALIASFDTYVLPSLWEGLPLGLLEALAQGTTIVATTVGGNPEIVEHSVNGFLVPPADSVALAEHILRVHRDPELRGRICALNRAKFAASFSLEAMIRSYVWLFEEQMTARRERARQPIAPAIVRSARPG